MYNKLTNKGNIRNSNEYCIFLNKIKFKRYENDKNDDLKANPPNKKKKNQFYKFGTIIVRKMSVKLGWISSLMCFTFNQVD